MKAIGIFVLIAIVLVSGVYGFKLEKNVKYERIDLFGEEVYVWYSTSSFGEAPVLIFSHGFGGCATQSLFLTEELAREGYVVIAINHDDANCDGNGETLDPNIFHPEEWNEDSFVDRRDDILFILDNLREVEEKLNVRLDSDRVGIVGHSLGGYTALGMAGGWDSWKDDRIKAVLALSPYVQPFLHNSDLGKIDIPVMLQGGTLDYAITPKLDESYGELNDPRFFLVLKRVGHFGWTNNICKRYSNTEECVRFNPRAKTIVKYSEKFFDKYLKNERSLDLFKKDFVLKSYEFSR
jgi:predicted dienelactone hydrolase